MNKQLKIGSHVENSGAWMLLGSVRETVANGANAMMFYLGAPQNTYRKPASELKIEEMHEAMAKHGLLLDDVVVHAPYIVNLAQSDDAKWQFAIDFLTNEVRLASIVKAKYLVIHPGAHVGMGVEYGLKRIAEGVKKIIANTPESNVVILLETMAGKGTECGKTFAEIKTMLDLIDCPDRTGVCLDTCHIHDAGYDIINDYEGVKQEFDSVVGLDKIKVIHLNDSKNVKGAKKDRHENIGFGMIGFDTLMKVIYDETFQDIPKILETPYVETTNGTEVSPYRAEIAMIKAKTFNPALLEELAKAAI